MKSTRHQFCGYELYLVQFLYLITIEPSFAESSTNCRISINAMALVLTVFFFNILCLTSFCSNVLTYRMTIFVVAKPTKSSRQRGRKGKGVVFTTTPIA